MGNKVVDFNIADYKPSYDTRIISDASALAHYYNNIGVERMLEGDVASAEGVESSFKVVDARGAACPGPLLAAALEALGRALAQPKRPLVAIVAGSKVSTKLTILKSLAGRVDRLIAGGGIANTFLLAAGLPVCVGGFHVSGCIAMLPELPADLKAAQDLGISFFAGEAEEHRLDAVLEEKVRVLVDLGLTIIVIRVSQLVRNHAPIDGLKAQRPRPSADPVHHHVLGTWG